MQANKQNPRLIQVSSHGQVIGTLTCRQFREYMNSRDFTANLVEQFNQMKARLGEPERVAQIINSN
ncbi:MAG: hypothetical protein WAT23_12650 [Chromatiaceae bacterium]